MKQTAFALLISTLLFACGDGRSNEGSTNGPGTMPADPAVMRQNQPVPASPKPATAAPDAAQGSNQPDTAKNAAPVR